MLNFENLQMKPTNNPLDWRNARPMDICKSWYMIWYKTPWQFEYFNAFKSNTKTFTENVKTSFVEIVKWRIETLKAENKTPVIVLPPKKKNRTQTMQYVIDELKEVEIIKIQSPDYKAIHFLTDRDERNKMVNDAAPNWKLVFNPEITKLSNIHYVFIDDFFTMGSTTRAVFNKLKENQELPSLAFDDDEVTNFECLYMARTQTKRNVKSKNMWIIDFELSETVNEYASNSNFDFSKRNQKGYE